MSATAVPDDIDNPVPDFSLAELKDREFSARVNGLRKTNNWRNWFSLAREWFCLGLILGGAISFFVHFRTAWGLSWFWDIPVTVLTITLVGTWQHRLVMLGHEAAHWILFRNRTLNEVAANWFCFYPLWGRSYSYRVQHFAHHQFVNDPERDPVTMEMVKCGNKFRYPMPLGEFIRECLIKLPLGVPNLIRYALTRARYASLGIPPECYRVMDPPPPTMVFLNVGYIASLIGILIYATITESLPLLFGAPPVWYLIYAVIARRVPEKCFLKTRIKSDLTQRVDVMQQMAFVTLLFTGLAALTHFTGYPWVLYYAVLWLAPLFTSFSYLMILREDIQHAHTGRDGLSHTRNFTGNPLIRWAVFPYRMNYHLPHHLYPFVPHYNLQKLESLLQQTEIYSENAIEVQAYLTHPH